MTSIRNQVTCSLCNIKTDELHKMYHLVSTNRLQLCENVKDKTALKFFEMNFSAYSKKNERKFLKNNRAHDFRQSYFAT